MRSLKSVYPEFANEVDFYAVNVDPTDKLESLIKFAEREGYEWQVAQPDASMLADFGITYQSTKVAIGGDGIITYRAGFGRGDADEWRRVMAELAASES